MEIKSENKRFVCSKHCEMLSTARYYLIAILIKGITCAICGGFAMELYGSPRATEDIDFIIPKHFWKQAITALSKLGAKVDECLRFEPNEPVLKLKYREIEVDLLEAESFHAIPMKFEEVKELPVITIPLLVTLKLLAFSSRKEQRDKIDLRWIIENKKVDEMELSKRGQKMYKQFIDVIRTIK